MSHSRYALYLTPPLESDLWKFGCDVLGRDARQGSFGSLRAGGPRPRSPGRKLTEEPRRYGFHATLVAPFALRADLDAPRPNRGGRRIRPRSTTRSRPASCKSAGSLLPMEGVRCAEADRTVRGASRARGEGRPPVLRVARPADRGRTQKARSRRPLAAPALLSRRMGLSLCAERIPSAYDSDQRAR